MAPAELDELEMEIPTRSGARGRRTISETERFLPAARQTVHVRIERLVRLGYIREEKQAGFPFRRCLSLTDRRKHALELKLSKERAMLEERERAVAVFLALDDLPTA